MTLELPGTAAWLVISLASVRPRNRTHAEELLERNAPRVCTVTMIRRMIVILRRAGMIALEFACREQL